MEEKIKYFFKTLNYLKTELQNQNIEIDYEYSLEKLAKQFRNEILNNYSQHKEVSEKEVIDKFIIQIIDFAIQFDRDTVIKGILSIKCLNNNSTTTLNIKSRNNLFDNQLN